MAPASGPPDASLRDTGFRGEILVEEPLAPHTTWRIGGPADLLAQPEDASDLARAIAWAAGCSVPWRILGNGSNLLVRDDGVRGLVLRIRKGLGRIEVDGTRIRAEGGASFPAVANLAAAQGLAGLEFAAGIPGTVGGAVLMNAGWHEFETRHIVESVEYLEAGGTTRTIAGRDCGFGYRRSAFRDRPGVVLSAVFSLSQDASEAVRARLESFASSRKQNQPTELPSCGSVFLKPDGDFAGRLIEQAGLKGLRVGDLEVSPKHANFFVNLGHGRASDALALVERVEREVESRFGVRLVREFEIW
jgi:UDP-N-acetylmuramate dehydrogenase